MRKVEVLIKNCLLQEMARTKWTAQRRAGSGKSNAAFAGKAAKQAHALGKSADGWPKPDREPLDITVPHPWGQMLKGSHIEGDLGLLTSWKLDTTKSTWGY